MGTTEETDATEIDALADRIFAAIEAGDAGSVAACWADDVEVWHNTDGITQTKAENLATLGWMVANTVAREYRDIRRRCHGNGFTQQHVLHLEFADGRSADLPAGLFVEIADGRVTRIDEYLDTAQVAAAFPPPGT